MQLNETGRIVQAVWLELPVRFPQVGVDSYIFMPNHIHGIILVGAQFIAPLNAVPDTLGDVLRAYKASSSRLIRQSINPVFAWQGNYYEHDIRSEESLNRIRQYIQDNPSAVGLRSGESCGNIR